MPLQLCRSLLYQQGAMNLRVESGLDASSLLAHCTKNLSVHAASLESKLLQPACGLRSRGARCCHLHLLIALQQPPPEARAALHGCSLQLCACNPLNRLCQSSNRCPFCAYWRLQHHVTLPASADALVVWHHRPQHSCQQLPSRLDFESSTTRSHRRMWVLHADSSALPRLCA